MSKVQVKVAKRRVYCPGRSCKRDRNVSNEWSGVSYAKISYRREDGTQEIFDVSNLCPACMARVARILGAPEKPVDSKVRWFDIPKVTSKAKGTGSK